ncbi:hypothetical protein A3H09_02190 [Candidatus Falkowbacteria bacterium RIFCSPLOWO2_12_FULL_45_13]|uniref:Uncharacterized protein n=2 Tax=Candidatus Falkowiibacteriota TaxID=1752728 RepID=A0A1F5SDF0_9BACT|nr:MAG: hypothetical protein A3H66_01615 [Candidatus Falkowbacteria bacterium RIFCSPLOWO2_02_FULL_45_21]OGF32138.1 MAG: hypothetical protein A3H09_02190 [Candidatus Falkowbacteria bacterium RIFCSPLOWO2_12_FULL_45_13]
MPKNLSKNLAVSPENIKNERNKNPASPVSFPSKYKIEVKFKFCKLSKPKIALTKINKEKTKKPHKTTSANPALFLVRINFS